VADPEIHRLVAQDDGHDVRADADDAFAVVQPFRLQYFLRGDADFQRRRVRSRACATHQQDTQCGPHGSCDIPHRHVIVVLSWWFLASPIAARSASAHGGRRRCVSFPQRRHSRARLTCIVVASSARAKIRLPAR
jgi:hypothetical protein